MTNSGPIKVSLLLAIIVCLFALYYQKHRTDIPKSITCNSISSSDEWNDCYSTVDGTFKRDTGYRISFTYKTLVSPGNGYFFMAINDLVATGKTRCWHTWTGNNGAAGTINEVFVDRDNDNYQLIIGIRGAGKVLIKHLKITPNPNLKPCHLCYPHSPVLWSAPANVTYYIDSRLGNDNADGLSPLKAWKSISKVNSAKFTAGDTILLRSGSIWTDPLAPSGSGTVNAPIKISSYGEGPLPRIDGDGKALAAIFLRNCSFVTIKNLDVTNTSNAPQPKLTGVTIDEENFGTAYNISFNNLDIHDVTGSDLKTEGGGAGINCICNGSRIPTRFDHLSISECHIANTDRDGITIHGCYERPHWFPSLSVKIDHNVLRNIGGDGIVPIGCDGAIIEHNVLQGARIRTSDFAAGIWPWSCDNTVVQYNDVSGVHGTNDGESFDSDWNCKNSLFQYNLSHNNDGGFMLICNDGTKTLPKYCGNNGTIVRYNVSINDGQYTFSVCGTTTNSQIYNNTIYSGTNAASRVLNGGTWGGWPSNTTFTNNVFESNHPMDFFFGSMTKTVLSHNYYGHLIQCDKRGDYALVGLANFRNGNGSRPKDFAPVLPSVLLKSGAIIRDNGGRDFTGNPVPLKTAPTVGAFQH